MAIHVTGDGPVVELIREIGGRLAAEGSWFSPDLEIAVNGSNVSMLSRKAFEQARSMIRVPLALMPALEDFQISVTKERFIVEPLSHDVPQSLQWLMQAQINVLNELGKISQWRAESPWFTLLQYPTVLDYLLTGRPKGIAGECREKVKAQAWDALMVDSFFNSRKFNVTPDVCKQIGRETDSGGLRVLMPLLDYFNHQAGAQGYALNKDQSPVSMTIKCCPSPKTRELFVRYNTLDLLDAYLLYGFVDSDVGHQASVPCEITFGKEWRLRVLGVNAGPEGDLPLRVRDLRLFLPKVRQVTEKEFRVTKLLIPGPRAPRALRRVLRVVLRSFEFPEEAVESAVIEIEDKLLDANAAWWTGLKAESEILPKTHVVHRLVNEGLGHIQRYRTLASSWALNSSAVAAGRPESQKANS